MNISLPLSKEKRFYSSKDIRKRKRKKKNFKLTQGWSHSDAAPSPKDHQPIKPPIFLAPNFLHFSPNILMHQKKKKKKKKWRSFSSTHVHEPQRDEFIRGSGRSRRKLETARSLNEIAAVSRYPAVFWFPFWRGNLNVVAIDSSAARAERILEIARARTSDDERGSSPFGREQAATPPYIFPLMPRAGFNGRNTGGEEGAGAREARRREASRRLHRRAQRVNVRA